MEALITSHFASPLIVSRGVVHDTRILPGLVVENVGRPVGVASYFFSASECELVAIAVEQAGAGLGAKLLEAVIAEARRNECGRLWLVTTNDNLPAQQFFLRHGFRLKQLHIGAVDTSRRLKPAIPVYGHGGVPMLDELEFEMLLSGRPQPELSQDLK